MTNLSIQRIDKHIKKIDLAAQWFSEKWDVPVEAYKESMEESLTKGQLIPKWYIVIDENEKIVAGAGVIANDFHNRPDLTPNVCAVYVEPTCRNRGIAKGLLSFICEDMKKMGFDILYLVTDHEELYEKFGWSFLTMVQDEEGSTRMYMSKL